MRNVQRQLAAACIVALMLVASCATQKPGIDGPVMSDRSIRRTFQPILDFMEYEKGMSFADVGAGSGAITVMMATLMDESQIYLQDIDSDILNAPNVNKTINYYSTRSGTDLRARNEFHVMIGETYHTGLPDSTFDIIYSNGTTHNFASLDSIASDLRHKLKPDGLLFFRDSFWDAQGEGEFCSDPTCGKRLYTIDGMIEVMKRNGFSVAKRAPDFSGYPIIGFQVDSREK